MKRKGRKSTGKHHKGFPTPTADKEMIIQLYAMNGNNKAAITKATGYAWATITKILKEAETSPSLQAVRARVCDAMAGRMNHKVDALIESIGPEDLESGLIKTRDKETGRLLAAKRYGPTLTEKATAAADGSMRCLFSSSANVGSSF